MILACLQLPVTDIVKAETFSKYLSLVEKHCFPSIRATQIWSEEIHRMEEADVDRGAGWKEYWELSSPSCCPMS